MTYGIDIDALLDSDNDIVKNETMKALELRYKLESGIISEGEYKDLTDDIARLDKINDLASDIETRTMLNEAFKIILKFLI